MDTPDKLIHSTGRLVHLQECAWCHGAETRVLPGSKCDNTPRLSWPGIKLVTTRSNGFPTASGMSWSAAGPTPCMTCGDLILALAAAKDR